ncbi:MAG: type II secretion system F family protein [Candidatus Micrarchaeota archaeon]|nr:type II secretion system F family protein [Candidatus Micrarchaeota archaeon]
MAGEIKRIPLMLLPLSACETIGSRFRGVGVKILPFYPSVRYDLRSIGISYPPENFCAIAFFSAMIWAMLISIFVGMLLARNAAIPPVAKVIFPMLALFFVAVFFLILHLSYPRMIAKSIASKIDRELIFAMRDMLIQISSGVPLFSAIDNLANSNYAYISKEFRIVSNHVKAGASLTEELEAMAVRTQSDYLKKTCWQIVTAVRSGANLASTLKGIVHMLVEYQFSLSKSFNSELNFIILVFLLTAAVLPTIGTTVLVVFSVFGMLGVTPEVFGGIIGLSFLAQMIVIGYVKMKRPTMFE